MSHQENKQEASQIKTLRRLLWLFTELYLSSSEMIYSESYDCEKVSPN